jgi:hypothetical protein
MLLLLVTLNKKIDLFQNPPLLITSYITPAMYDLLNHQILTLSMQQENALIITHHF